MHMFAGGDVARGAADRLGIFDHRLTGRNRPDRRLVAGFDPRHSLRPAGKRFARIDRNRGDGDVILRRKKNRRR